tara:strand:+ start:1415 stop:1675 length:261 start_codon:yes stop_codon:yes gene_type:complete
VSGDHLHPEPFFLVVVDRDNAVFNVFGPLSHDAPYVRAVSLAQQKGRNIDLHNPGEFDNRDDVIDNLQRQLGFSHSDEPIVALKGD